MFAATTTSFDTEHPLNGLTLGDHAEPVPPDDTWTTVTVRATALNHHDLWSLKGVGLRIEELPMILGTDASGVDEEGNEVVVHAVIGDPARGGGDGPSTRSAHCCPRCATGRSASGSRCRVATWCRSRRPCRSSRRAAYRRHGSPRTGC